MPFKKCFLEIGPFINPEQFFVFNIFSATSKDLFIPVSTSGNSPNIIKAIKYAKKIGLKTIGLTGKKGGKMGKLCNTINIPSIKEGSARTHFDSLNPLQRRAYYRFSNLVASEQVTNVISDRHVIMDRYWTSTAAFAAMDEGFEHDIEIGQYPDEIRKPDLLILLTVDEENRLTRLHGRGEAETKEESELAASKIKREKVLETYLKFKPVVIDTSNKSPDEVCQEALEIIQEAFQ